MAHKAILTLENKEYNLIECEYEFIQSIKENGQPAGRSSGSLIHFTMIAPDDNNTRFHDWMQSATEHKDGQIVFEITGDETPPIKTLQFKHAYCVRLYEYFSLYNNTQMLAKITISAAEISFGREGNVAFKNDQK